MEDSPTNNLQPSGDNVVPHAAAEADIAAVADQMADRAAELLHQVGKPESAPEPSATDDVALPLEQHISKVEGIVNQIADDVGSDNGSASAGLPAASPPAAEAITAAAPAPLTATAQLLTQPPPSRDEPAITSSDLTSPIKGESPLTAPKTAASAKPAPPAPKVKKAKSFSMTSLLLPAVGLLEIIDAPFRRVPANVKNMLGYVALASSFTAVLVWTYALLT